MKEIGTVILAVQKAFDVVDHDITCGKITAVGLDPVLLRSDLDNRKQTVLSVKMCNLNKLFTFPCHNPGTIGLPDI